MSKKYPTSPSDRLALGRRSAPPRSPLRLAQEARSRLQHFRERRTLVATHCVGRVALLRVDLQDCDTDDPHSI